MRKHLAVCAVTAVAALSLTACGSGDEDKAKANLATSIQEENFGNAKVTEKQADCLANDMVDEVGVEKLQDYKILDKDLKVDDAGFDDAKLEEKDADAVAEAFVSCIGTEELLAEQILDDSMSKEQKDCIMQVMDEDAIKRMTSASLQGKDLDDEGADLQKDLAKCMTG